MEDNKNIDARIERLIQLAKKHGLSSLSVEDEESAISFEIAGRVSPTEVTKSTTETKVMNSPETDSAETEEGSYVLAPFNGTFYNSPSPESSAFVKEGGRVSNGDVLCIIEAMKVMNEIQTETDGVIKKILKENGHPVEKGEPLFLIA
jgi:acetyl-CoA carboxylase biotin carboxyl carrier protein